MNETADRVAVKLLALIAPEEEWFTLISAESAGQLQRTALVQNLRIDPHVVLEAATDIRMYRAEYERIRPILFSECPCPPCFFSLSGVILELMRLYYQFRAPRPGTVA